MKRILGLALTASFLSPAAQFTATPDIYTTGSTFASSYTGPAIVVRGAVQDGGLNAFNDFGYAWRSVNIAGVTHSRRVELLPGNVYRWIDTLTNTGLNDALTGLEFNGRLGSGTNTTYELVTPYLQITSDSPVGSVPVVAFVWGNNDVAAGAQRVTPPMGGLQITIPLSLAPGESKSLMFFAFLARELDSRILAADVTLATTRINQLFNSPEMSGLSRSEQDAIVNWGTSVPEPATWATLGAGLSLLLARRARRMRTTPRL